MGDQLLASRYESWKPSVQRDVSRRICDLNVHVPMADLDEFYNQAWYALHAALTSGKAIARPRGFLVTVMFRRAIDGSRQARRAANIDDASLVSETDVAAIVDARLGLRQFVGELAGSLSARDCRAALLCYVLGYSRPDAARVMGVSRRRFERIMDGHGSERPGVAKKVAAVRRRLAGAGHGHV